jgi:prepilin-type N-terminal cleavage/methylation domain-containing protein
MLKRNGFTMIELVMVIVILGILAAVALPRFMDMRGDAEESVVSGLAGSLRTARGLAYGKLVLCGGLYGNNSPLHMGHFVRLDNNPPEEFICTGGGISGHTIGVDGIRDSLLENPGDSILDNISGDVMTLNTKAGHVVTITHNPATGAITWTATPSY